MIVHKHVIWRRTKKTQTKSIWTVRLHNSSSIICDQWSQMDLTAVLFFLHSLAKLPRAFCWKFMRWLPHSIVSNASSIKKKTKVHISKWQNKCGHIRSAPSPHTYTHTRKNTTKKGYTIWNCGRTFDWHVTFEIVGCHCFYVLQQFTFSTKCDTKQPMSISF